MRKQVKKYYTIYRYDKRNDNLVYVAQTASTYRVQEIFDCTLKHIADYKARYNKALDKYEIKKRTIEDLVLIIDYDKA